MMMMMMMMMMMKLLKMMKSALEILGNRLHVDKNDNENS